MTVTQALALAFKRAFDLQFPQAETSSIVERSQGDFVIYVSFGGEEPPADLLARWVEEQAPAGLQVEVQTSLLPEGAHPLDTSSDDPYLRPEIRTRQQMLYDLCLELPHLPLREFTDSARDLVIHLDRSLTADEETRLSAVLRRFGIDGSTRVQTDNSEPAGQPGLATGAPLSLILARQVNDPTLHEFCDKDEDVWSRVRGQALATPECIDLDRPGTGAKCLVFTEFFPSLNLRNCLLLYDTVFMTVPTTEDQNSAFGALGVSAEEIVQLVRTGRVKLVLTRSVDRYNSHFLRTALESGQDGVLGPRQLAALGLADFAYRNAALLSPAYEDMRRRALPVMDEVARISTDQQTAATASAIAEWIRNLQLFLPVMLNRQGPATWASLGAGRLTALLYRARTGQDIVAECALAGESVHLAAGLGATLFPQTLGSASGADAGISLEPHASMIAALYSGHRGQVVSPDQPGLTPLIEGITTVDDHVPILELAQAVASESDIAGLRRLIVGIASTAPTEDEIRQVVEHYNRAVTRFRRNSMIIGPLDLTGLAFSSVGSGIGNWVVVVALGLAHAMLHHFRGQSAAISALLDGFEGVATLTHPDTVLVARLRRQIQEVRR